MKFLDNLTEEIVTREAYAYFKENKKFNHKSFDDFFKWRNIIGGLIKATAILNFNSKAGVYIKGIGYFASVPICIREGARMSLVRTRPSKIQYLRKFYPDDPLMEDWTLDEVFNSLEHYEVRLSEVEFYKKQNTNAKYINKRANSRSRI